MRDSLKHLVLLHGVNLDLLGERPVTHYGTITLRALEQSVSEEVERLGWICVSRQTNHEGEYVEYIHEFRHAGALLVNPGAWTHYSYAIRDALEIVTCPVAEVHLSDIVSREKWRRLSVISPVVSFTVAGKGPEGYIEAARRLIALAGASAVAGG
jgi:3-dehydroquinate dehydratase II